MKLTYVCPAPRQTLREILRNDLKLTYHQTQETARNGRIRIDGKPFFFNQVPREGQLLEIDLPAFAPWKVSDESLSLPSPEVLYRDDALLAVNKPHNLVVHQPPHQQHFEDTLQLRIHAHLSPRYHALHRLDAETGGIVLFTRYPYVTSVFHRYLEEHLVHKVYDALTEGWIPEDAMTIDLPIERLEPDSFTRVVREDGKPSRTEVRVLERLCIAGRRITRVQLSPVTGRTHQLRVHLSHIGFPILGDPRYASVQSSETSQLLRISFLQLFAREMTLPHPQSGQPLILRAPSDIGSDITDD